MFGNLGATELILILSIVLIIFGIGKLPQVGEGLGKAIKGFKRSVQEEDALDAETPKQETPSPSGEQPGPTPASPVAQPIAASGTMPPGQAPAAPKSPKT